MTEATAAMPLREWTPGNRSMEGRRGPVEGERYGSNVGGGRRDRDESQERGSETTDPGLWNKNSGEERSPRGPALVGRSNTVGKTAMVLESSKVRSGNRQGRTRCGMANKPARATSQVNQRNRRESVPFAAALKSP